MTVATKIHQMSSTLLFLFDLLIYVLCWWCHQPIHLNTFECLNFFQPRTKNHLWLLNFSNAFFSQCISLNFGNLELVQTKTTNIRVLLKCVYSSTIPLRFYPKFDIVEFFQPRTIGICALPKRVYLLFFVSNQKNIGICVKFKRIDIFECCPPEPRPTGNQMYTRFT